MVTLHIQTAFYRGFNCLNNISYYIIQNYLVIACDVKVHLNDIYQNLLREVQYYY